MSVGAFPDAKQLDIIYTNESDANLRLLLPPFRLGALPLLEEFCIEGNFASDAFMIDFSDAAAEGAFPALLTLNLSLNHIGNLGVRAFASACARGALPYLTKLQLRRNFALGDEAMHVDLATTLDDRRSLPSLAELLLSQPCCDHQKLISSCKVRGIKIGKYA